MTDSTLTTGAAASQPTVPLPPQGVTGRWKDPVPEDPAIVKRLRAASRPQSTVGPSVPSVPPINTSDEPSSTLIVPFLVSTIIHTILLIILALMTYSTKVGSGRSLTARQGETTVVIPLESVETEPTVTININGAMAEEPVAVHFARADPAAMASPIASVLPSTNTEPAEIPVAASLADGGKPATLSRLPGGGLSGRTPEGRKRLGEKYGASGPSERAVEEALRYLAEHQRRDGSWSFNLKLDPCNGRCTHSTKGGDNPAPSTAATGLALLAFLGAGHTHIGSTEYAETVRKGIYYLRDVASESEAGYDWQKGSMYGHGIALMALGEALSMTTKKGHEKESDIYELVQRGAQFSCIAQHNSGSWGYRPQSPGDTTVTGWQVLSLVAARRSHVDLQTHTLQMAKKFLKSTCENDGYWFGYQGPPGEKTTTAIGLTMMLYLGESHQKTLFRIALDEMAARGPMLNNIYHDYYATLALHHARHHDWDQWNQRLRDHLVATQEKEGHQRGSWHFPGEKYGDVGGRLYTTAMCTLTLEVYYRYLPMYEDVEEFPLD
ncbi:hypothetical protein Poly51_19930 [Rubripirellula tenax]|uniref:Squalene cyclase C-terminal domain-containing protein n=1 Tax=Rubripirellula tenax TaxID=2528015 RepID=A0A5C6FER0_9BACT|nr:prenyltransferase/squalene oxidase repeat-containing protein [Rubripirellula tenax]TWU59207.1 hypothetical protein Poly51_19930 [Rubripirellula tenax]